MRPLEAAGLIPRQGGLSKEELICQFGTVISTSRFAGCRVHPKSATAGGEGACQRQVELHGSGSPGGGEGEQECPQLPSLPVTALENACLPAPGGSRRHDSQKETLLPAHTQLQLPLSHLGLLCQRPAREGVVVGS